MIDYDDVVSACDAHGIKLPVEAIETTADLVNMFVAQALAAYIAETEYPVKQIGVPHPSGKPTVVTLSAPTAPVQSCGEDGTNGAMGELTKECIAEIATEFYDAGDGDTEHGYFDVEGFSAAIARAVLAASAPTLGAPIAPAQRHAADCKYVTDDNPWAPCTCGFGGPNDSAPAQEPYYQCIAGTRFKFWANELGELQCEEAPAQGKPFGYVSDFGIQSMERSGHVSIFRKKSPMNDATGSSHPLYFGPQPSQPALSDAVRELRRKIADAPRRQFESAPRIYTHWLSQDAVLDILDAEIVRIERGRLSDADD